MSDSSNTDLLNIFWEEVGEHLETLNAGLLHVEMGTADDHAELLRELNRAAHSMKGAARAVGIQTVESIGFYIEEIFEQAQAGVFDLSPDVCDVLYDGLDVIQNVMAGVETSAEALASVMARLEVAVVGGKAVGAAADEENGRQAQMTAAVASAPEATQALTTQPPAEVDTGGLSPASATTVTLRQLEDMVRVPVHRMDLLMADASELLVARMRSEERQRDVYDLRKLHAKWQREWRGIRASYIRLARRLQHRQDDDEALEIATLFKFMETNQRYLLDANRRLVQLAQTMAQDNMRFNAVADQLQDRIGEMRLVPFESVLSGFQRMVRDIARDEGKQVQLQVEGAGVELDKTVLDALKDPIMHLLRNSLDHGIETPAERERLGKPPAARLELAVEQRGSEILVRVADDGRGINSDKVRGSVVQAGLLTEQEAATLSDDDVRLYIFHPGLSTSDKVTALSGRGVGLDVVRVRVESLRGRVSVRSIVGEGTVFSLSMPVSLTRMQCIVVRVGEEEFAVPAGMIMQMLTLRRDDVFTAEGNMMVLVDDVPVPLVSLHSILDLTIPPPEEQTDELIVVVIRTADRTVAFEVDKLQAEQELILKPLGAELTNAPHVSGAALLGTGDVIIVLDANDLVRSASGTVIPRYWSAPLVAEGDDSAERRARILVADDSITTRMLEKNILETAGYDVHVAVDGAEAWSMLAENNFDVVISDVEMPNMTGLELARKIKDHSKFQHVPVILLTSLGKPEQREAGLRAGADAYLVKSRFEQEELLRTIRTFV